jgi:hypothetical protein
MPRGTCWKGYVQKGFKKKGNRSVPNCVAVQNAYLGRAVKQPSETENEFQIRHEYHTPFKGPQKARVGKMIKKYKTGDEVQGPQEKEKEGFAIEPQVRGATSFDQNIEKKTKGVSLYLHTPGYGKVGVHYDKDTDTDFGGKLDTKRKNVSYDIQKDIGSGTLTAGASIGTSDNELRKGKTKSGMLSYTIPLSKTKGGIIKGKPKLALRGWK